MTLNRIVRWICAFSFLVVLAAMPEPAWATLPTPNQPILVVKDTSSGEPYQNFVPELLTTEGLNGFQTAELPELTPDFLANYDLVILPHFTLSAAQATLFQNYVNAGGTLVGFRPDLQLASVFGVTSLGTTLSEGWLKIDTSTPYGSALDSQVMKFHGTADMYSLSGATALATLYNSSTLPTTSPAASIYTFGSGKGILFSFDLSQSIVLMRQGNPAWAGYPNNHDGYNTLRASQMFMDQGTGQFWNDLGDGVLNDVPQADIQLRLFSNAVVLSNSIRRPLPRFWYFPNQNRALLLMTGDHHGDQESNSIAEINAIQTFGGKFSEFLWYPFVAVSDSQVNTWLAAGHTMGIHFNDTAEVDGTFVGGSAASWSGMQSVINTAISSFATTHPSSPFPATTRNHFLIWLSRNAAGAPDQTAQAKLFQSAGIELDTTFAAFPNRWGYMTGSGLPMKFLDTATGSVIPVYEQATQFEDDIQLSGLVYSTNWNLATARTHYQKALSDSLTKYNTIVTMLFHPDSWSVYGNYAQTVLQYAQSHSIPIVSAGDWLHFWKGRTTAGLSNPVFVSNTLTFDTTASTDGLTLLIPYASGNNLVTALQVDGGPQSFTVEMYQGVTYASVVLAAGPHGISVTYAPGVRILGRIAPSAAAASTTIQVQGGPIPQTVSPATDGTYSTALLPPGTYSVTPSSSVYVFSPASRSVTLGGVDVSNVNFTATANIVGQTLFTTQTPVVTNATDGTSYELATAFTSDVAGEITAVRFWKAPSESGTHVGKIWSSTGTVLASVAFSNETPSGWQQQALDTPLNIAADTAYVVSVNTANNFYVASNGTLATQLVTGHLKSVVGNNGLFGPSGQFPTSSFSSTNYFRDIFFLPGVSGTLSSVAVTPSSVAGGNSSTGTVTLSNPAPAGGVEITLASDTTLASVPESVMIAEGATTANFSVDTGVTSTPTSATILGSYNGFRSATLAINPLEIASVSLSPSTVLGGNSSDGTVILNGPAPSGGVIVTLTDDNASTTTPSFVNIPEGATGATFTVTSVPVSSITNVTIAATYHVTKSATLTLNPVGVASVLLNPSTVMGSQTSTATVTLGTPAPTGGVNVALSSNNAAAIVPSTVTVAAGATSANFNVTTSAVEDSTSAIISATFNGSQSATLTINASALSSVSLSPETVDGGSPSIGTVSLINPAPASGAVVTLSSNNAAATVPASVTVPAGKSAADFPVDTSAVGSMISVVITGSYTVTETATLTIEPPVLESVSLNPTTVNGGSTSTATVTLGSPAPASGAVVTLSSGNAAATVPATVTVAAGATTANFQINTIAVSSVTSAIIAGDYNGAQTATLTINAPVLTSVSLNPATVTGGVSSTATVTLSSPAPASGAMVALSSGNAAATLPATVTVAAGATTANFQVDTVAVASVTSAIITGNYHGAQTATLTINAPVLTSVSLNPTTVTGGSSSTGTVTLSSPAPASGADVTLSSSDGAATVPVSVTVAAGATTATFQVNTTPVGSAISAIITGNFNGSQTATLAVNPPTLLSVSLSPATLLGGTSSTGTLTLDGPAPQTGSQVTLSSGDAAATVPANVTVVAGATTADFQIDTVIVGSVTSAIVTGNYNGTRTNTLTINPPVLSSVSLNPATLTGGTSSTATVTLSSPAPASGAVVTLSSGNAAATVPATVTVTGGATTANFQIDTTAVASVTSAIVTGNYNGAQTATLTINPPVISSVSLNPATLTGGSSSSATVTLNGPAPAAGAVVTLSSSDTAATVPPTVTVAAGLTTNTFQIDTTAVASATSAVITGNLNGTQTATLTINPPAFVSLSLNPATLVGGNPSAATVTLNGPAPAGGVVVTLSSGDPAATVLPTVTVAAGATTANVQVDTVAVGSVTSAVITGNHDGIQTATLTINPPVLSSVSLNPTNVFGTVSSSGTVTLSSPAPAGGSVVTLSSGDPAATVPVDVTVAAGATSANFQIETIAVSSATSAIITGSYNGAKAATLTINPPVLSSVVLNHNTLTGGSPSAGTVTLSSPAPAGGVIVTLLSDNAAAIVPASVTVAGGATAANFAISTAGVGSVTTVSISASFNGTQSAPLTINPGLLTGVLLTPTGVIGGNPAVGTVTLSGPAPAAGAVVALASDNAIAAVPPTVTIAGGTITANFPVTTGTVITPAAANISATYLGTTHSAPLAIDIAVLSTLSLNPASIAGGNTSTGTVMLTGPAPAGGALVTLASDDPSVSSISGVYSLAGLPAPGSTSWTALGPEYSSIASGASAPVNGLPGVTMTLSTATGLPMMTLTNCANGGDCGWYGNFASGASVLWMNGTYTTETGWWAPNGPLTVTLSSPQRGVGMQIMADESGPFIATVCAYNSSDTLLGCVPFDGNANGSADNSAVFIGVYDDVQEIAKITIDNNGPLYPHDFAISNILVTGTRRQMVPTSVLIPAGATSANFTASTSAVSTVTTVNITGTYVATKSATLTINPAVLSTITFNPSSVIGGTSLLGTVTLTGAAPAGGATVTLAADNPVAPGVQRVTAITGLPKSGSVDWVNVGADYELLASGSSVPVSGIPGLNMTVSTTTGGPVQIVTNCPGIVDCGWDGNFAPAAQLLWVNGIYNGLTGSWTPNGPMTITLSAPQRGVGFQIMADEAGPVTATVCAYDSSNVLLSCAPFSGTGTPYADGSAPFIGLYDDVQEIAKITIDGGGTFYPHDFAIGQVYVAQSRRMVPPSIKVQAGATSITFPVNTDMVTTDTTVTVTGNYQVVRTGTLTVTAPMLSSISVSPATVVGGASSTGTVTLRTAAPTGGTIVALSSNNAAATVPANVTVAAGSTTANFSISTTPLFASTLVTIAATNNGTMRTTTLTVNPAALSSLSLNPSSMAGGNSSTGTVTLTGVAPTGGILVALSDDNANASEPANVTVPAGATTATFTVTSVPVTATANVTVTSVYNGVTRTAPLTITPAALTTLAMSPTSVVGGSSSTGTVTLTGPAPAGGILITLSDNSGSSTTPANVTVPAGATTATFTVSTLAVTATTTVTITSVHNGVTRTATLSITAPVLSTLTMNPTAVTGGTSSIGTVTLTGPAPTGGIAVTLSDNSSSATTPASVTVPAGATSANFTVTSISVGAATTVTVTATRSPVTLTANFTLNPPQILSITLNPTTVVGGLANSTATVTLNAPAAGSTAQRRVTLLSSNTAAATVPVNVTVAAGATTATFTVTSHVVLSTATSSISATMNAGTKSATLTVSPVL